eukprot:scaffold7794_cov325-Pinguiococcus_pyrenoidosus.AAC.1
MPSSTSSRDSSSHPFVELLSVLVGLRRSTTDCMPWAGGFCERSTPSLRWYPNHMALALREGRSTAKMSYRKESRISFGYTTSSSAFKVQSMRTSSKMSPGITST